MNFDLQILGCSGAQPANGLHPAAQVLTVHEQPFLMDCGEGTQMQMERFKVKRGKINQIFISHSHGDHYFGLAGLLTSYALAGRKAALTIFGPAALIPILKLQVWDFDEIEGPYPLKYISILADKPRIIYEDAIVKVTTIPLDHRVATTGFLIQEKELPRRIFKEKIEEYNIPYTSIKGIKDGEDFVLENGDRISNEELTAVAPRARSYAYCSDTAYKEDIVAVIRGVDLLYHEATFCEDYLAQAIKTRHSTAKQAATIASKAAVGKLVMGHFSARYKDLSLFIEEAKTVFENSFLGQEGKVYSIAFDKKNSNT